MRLSLIVPGLLALPDAVLANCGPLGAFARDGKPEVIGDGIEAATLRVLELDAPIGALTALGAGVEIGNDYVLCADPVALVAGHEDVRLLGRIDDLSQDEVEALRARLNAHFAGDGIVFETPRADRWIARLRVAPAIATTPLARVRDRPLAPLLPTGNDGRQWRRWQNEIQMLLHEHSVNVAREAGGRAPVSGLWFWGGGTLATTAPDKDVLQLLHPVSSPRVKPAPERPTTTPPDSRLRGIDEGRDIKLYACGGREGDLLRGVARREGLEPSTTGAGFDTIASANPPDSHVIVALPALQSENELSWLVEAWIDPALRRLRQGQLDNLRLVADTGALATIWSARRPSLLARILSRPSGSKFVKPQLPDGE